MDISNVSVNGAVSAVLAQKEVYNQEQVSEGMLKKALDTQSQSALALIESIPQITPTTQGLPANLGNHINTTA